MGLQQSKEALLYQQVIDGNIEGIKSLHQQGASLEWVDKEGMTPLIAACTKLNLYDVAKTLIELGANVNAYQPGTHGGTALHHAAKRGLQPTVELLLSHGANALAVNDDGLTPLEVARVKGFGSVVRTIESHICFFCGWLRELHGPGFLGALIPQVLSRKVWVVVVPRGTRNPRKPLKLELAIYGHLQDCRPRTIITLWKAKIEEPKLNQPVPVVDIFDKATRTRYKLASSDEGDKKQLQWLCNACRGIPQVMQPMLLPHDARTPAAPSDGENVEQAMVVTDSVLPQIHDSRIISMDSAANGWGASLEDSSHSGWLATDRPALSEASSSGWLNEHHVDAYSGWGTPEAGTKNNTQQNTPPVNAIHETTSFLEANNPSHNGWGPVGGSSFLSKESSTGWLDKPAEVVHNGWGTTESGSRSNLATSAVLMTDEVMETASVPSAPPATDDVDYGPIHYPSIDSSRVDVTLPNVKNKEASVTQAKDDVGSSSCVICLDAPVEGACIPCGHMVGCMSCLNDIKSKKWGCPVCRSKIDQVIKLYAV